MCSRPPASRRHGRAFGYFWNAATGWTVELRLLRFFHTTGPEILDLHIDYAFFNFLSQFSRLLSRNFVAGFNVFWKGRKSGRRFSFGLRFRSSPNPRGAAFFEGRRLVTPTLKNGALRGSVVVCIANRVPALSINRGRSTHHANLSGAKVSTSNPGSRSAGRGRSAVIFQMGITGDAGR